MKRNPEQKPRVSQPPIYLLVTQYRMKTPNSLPMPSFPVAPSQTKLIQPPRHLALISTPS